MIEKLVNICKGKQWYPYRHQIDVKRAVRLVAIDFAIDELDNFDIALDAVDEVVRRLK